MLENFQQVFENGMLERKKESKHFNYILRELQNIYKNNNKYDIKFIYIYIKIFKSLIFLRETDPVKRIVHIN